MYKASPHTPGAKKRFDRDFNSLFWHGRMALDELGARAGGQIPLTDYLILKKMSTELFSLNSLEKVI